MLSAMVYSMYNTLRRYPGACLVNTQMAVRATAAAPTFFTPVPWEGGLYCDGALVANNPTAIALQEAKVIYPGVPVELVVSVGTGYYNQKTEAKTLAWPLLGKSLYIHAQFHCDEWTTSPFDVLMY
jgi:predicted acylesterase/phospholipase RssA